MYAGSRWGLGCYPDELLKEDGYINKIKKMIDVDGIDSFEVLRTDSNCDGLSSYDYETLFLETNDCQSSKEWLNYHNNTRMPPPFGSDEFNEIIFDKYGCDHVSRSPEIVKKKKKTLLDRYGDEEYRNIEKAIETRLIKYSEENGGYLEVNKKEQTQN